MKNEIKVSGVSVSGEISYDMLNMFNKNENKTTPLMILFWEPQKKLHWLQNQHLVMTNCVNQILFVTQQKDSLRLSECY